jgi:hypothetical protein
VRATAPREIRELEVALERRVSERICAMPFLWLLIAEFILTLASAAAAWPLAARAQQPPMPVIDFLRSAPFVGAEHLVRAFRQGLNDTGFIEGQNVLIEYRAPPRAIQAAWPRWRANW